MARFRGVDGGPALTRPYSMTDGAGASPGADRREPAPIPHPALFHVDRVRRETSDTWTLDLSAAAGRAAFPFAPGQFNMLYAFGAGEVPISICGDPGRPHVLVHTIRSVGSVTRALCGMRKGEAIGVRGPFGVPWPVEEAHGRDIVIIAGGIGLASVRPILYHVLANRSVYGRLALLYGSRTPHDLLYPKELERWRARLDVEVQVTVDAATRGWRGNVGFVTTLVPRAPFTPANATAFICGPEIMMRFSALELQRRGLAPEHIYLSMERNMKCAVGLCGHCQFGAYFVCKDGPVFALPRVQPFLTVREI
jgi:NAD(P)H-flavin reductase